MKNPFKAYREWRDRRFRERVDRVYFHTDEHGNKEMQGQLFIDGDLAVKRSSSCHFPNGNPFKSKGRELADILARVDRSEKSVDL